MELLNFKEMKQVDIRNVDKKSLVEIGTIEIGKSISKEERIIQFIKKIKNPYCFLCEGIIVKSTFEKTDENLESRLIELITRMEEK